MGQRSAFSLIIPTFNRLRPLAACLNSVAQLHFPPAQLEIIVVNDGGADIHHLPEIQAHSNVIVHTQPNAGPAAARNTGAARASGDFLAFLDDDCQPEPDWLAKLAAQLEITPGHLVGGSTCNALTGNRYAAASQLLVDYLYDYYNNREAGPHFFTSNNFALSAALFRQIGGFDTTFPLAAGEDRDFCDRWRQAGWQLTYVPEAIIYHAHHLTWRTFWQQHVGYGRGAHHFHRLRRQRQQEKLSVEPPSFYINLVLYPFHAAKKERGRSLTAVLLAMTQLANGWGYFVQSRRPSG